MVENENEYSSPLRIKKATRKRFDKLSIVESVKTGVKDVTHDVLLNAVMDAYEKQNGDLLKVVNFPKEVQ